MAKQKGLYQLRGKIDGISHYTQKGVEAGLARKIDLGLSNRVKNDAAYANTRLNAAEFGTAGSFAGAVIRSISERKRAMMKDFATGDLAKVVRAEFLKDTTHVWGGRQFTGTAWRNLVVNKIAQYAKLSWSDFVGVSVVASLEGTEVGSVISSTISADEGWGSLLAAKGATSVRFEIFGVGVGFVAAGDAPYRSSNYSIPIKTIETGVGGEFTETASASLPYTLEEFVAPNSLSAVLVIAKPIKEVGTQKYILQELCTYSYVLPEVQE